MTQTGPPFFFFRSHLDTMQQPAIDLCSYLPPSLPPYIGVHYIQQVQIRLLSNIHRAGACGSPASAHEACLRKTVTKLLLSGVGLEQDLAGHKYITASLNVDSTGGEK